MKRLTVFCIQVGWLVLLAGAAAYYFFWFNAADPVMLGPVPIGVVWFGALGAVLISLTGVVEHAHDWDPSYDLWHLSRPLIGAAFGVVSVLILQAGVLAIGAQPIAQDQGTPRNLLYYLVSFLVGYREETFRELIKRLVDLLLAPATTAHAATPSIAFLDPKKGSIAGGFSVRISGANLADATRVAFGSTPAAFTINSDGQISAVAPVSPQAGLAGVTVRTKRGLASSPFEYV